MNEKTGTVAIEKPAQKSLPTFRSGIFDRQFTEEIRQVI